MNFLADLKLDGLQTDIKYIYSYSGETETRSCLTCGWVGGADLKFIGPFVCTLENELTCGHGRGELADEFGVCKCVCVSLCKLPHAIYGHIREEGH